MSDDIHIINLHNASVSPGMLAQIATALETYGSVKVVNAAIPAHGPGLAALMLGNAFRPDFFDASPKEGEK